MIEADRDMRMLEDADVESRAFTLLMETNNEMAVLHRELAQKTIALEKAIAQNNQFLGMAAHDLRNPLHVIGGMSAVLLRSATLDDKQRKLLQVISDSSSFMRRLVDDLLQVSEFEGGQLNLVVAPFSLSELVAERVELQRAIAVDKCIDIRFRCQSECAALSGDRMRLTQVIDNLLSNAIKYSQPRTSVMVHLHAAHGMARISVRDQGQGIPPGEIGKLFMPFGVTSTRATGGEKSTGLGLLIVRRIVEAHHGSVRVRSRLGNGTTFHVILPLAAHMSAS